MATSHTGSRNHTETQWEPGRVPVITKPESDEKMVATAYNILDASSSDFVNIHNGFNFDLRSLAALSALDTMVGSTFEEMRLGKSGLGVRWALTNGSIVVDSMYTADKIWRSEWDSLAVAKIAETFDLPPKLSSGTMEICVSDQARMRPPIRSRPSGSMGRCNCFVITSGSLVAYMDAVESSIMIASMSMHMMQNAW
ncbi:MAG: hypothetical protein Q9207_002981 [Kuettlingeria erythrocarpa]